MKIKIATMFSLWTALLILPHEASWAAGAEIASEAAAAEKAETTAPQTLRVAVVQFHSVANLADNVARIKAHLQKCAAQGVRVVAFPECALTAYSKELDQLSPQEIAQAESEVALACRASSIYAIVGTPHWHGSTLYNTATVISPEGKIIERYHKIQLVGGDRWASPGDHLSVFRIDGVPCSIIVCHDERYPELVRLPVLAGAQVVFYISNESSVREESKLGPYRAQIQARAVENTVYIVHANAPAEQDASVSHGQSRIIATDGNIIQEASIFGEDVLIADLKLDQATRELALNSLKRGPLQDWWADGVKRVRLIE